MGRHKKVVDVEVKPATYQAADTYGFEQTMQALKKAGFTVDQIDGVLYTFLCKADSFKESYKQVERIIQEEHFRGSWGVKQ